MQMDASFFRVLPAQPTPAGGRVVGTRGRLGAQAPAFLLLAAFWALTHPYGGIVSDATIYIGRALADLDPAGLGQDLGFANDGQSHFSLFPILLRLLVARFGTEPTSIAVAILGSAAWFCALVVFAHRIAKGSLASEPVAWTIVAFVSVLSSDYGLAPHFAYAETSAIPRPFAEAGVLAALGALLAGRRGLALLLLGGAALLHPLMALAGIGVFALVLCFEDRRVGFAALAALGAGLLGAWLGVPLLERLFVPVEPAWKAFLMDRSPHLFPTLWSSVTFGTIVMQSATVLIAAQLRVGIQRKLLLAVLAVGLAGPFIAGLFGDVLSSLLIVQAQPWRAAWLLQACAGAAFAICAVELWRRPPASRLVLVLLAFGWFFSVDAPFAVLIAGCALLLHFDRFDLARRIAMKHVAIVVALLLPLTLVYQAEMLVAYATYLRDRPASLPFDLFIIVRNSLFALPVCALAVVIALRGRVARGVLPAAFLLLTLLTGLLWDQRTSFQTLLDKGLAPPDLAKMVAGEPGEVLWIDGLAEPWYLLGRPQWVSPQQAVSMVFSRNLAFTWRARMQFLMDQGLAAKNSLHPWQVEEPSEDVHVTPATVQRLCTRPDAPAWIIAPLLRGAAMPESLIARIWTLPTAEITRTPGEDGVIWKTIDRAMVIGCAEMRRHV